jgi:DNA-directed RNA polymerase subunit RPC12/RpoP
MTDAITYKCPKCGATLKPGKPIPAGKKIKCPKCENIFAPTAEQPQAAAKPGGVSKPKFADDEDGGGLYALKDEPAPPEPDAKAAVADDDDEQPKKKKKKGASQEDEESEKKAPARKKGVAQAICQKPSNQMLATSSFACASCILSLLVALWPILFAKEKTWYIPLVVTESFPVMLLIPLLIGAFVYNGLIAVGAVKMQSIESYSWATMAAMMTIIPASGLLAVPAFAWFYRFLEAILGPGNMLVLATVFCVAVWYLYVGMWNLKTLREADVIAGFSEKSEYGD